MNAEFIEFWGQNTWVGNFWLGTLSGTLVVAIRYLLFAGGFYWLCWIKNRDTWRSRRIDPSYPSRQSILNEIRYSLLTCIVFGISGSVAMFCWKQGWTQIYTHPAKYGWTYFALSIPLLMLLHETYFYWSHRLMHHPKIFRTVHRIHHLSQNPSPWAAFSFHPWEAVIEAVILPLLLMVVPVHPIAFLIFLMTMTFLGTINHLGYELYSQDFSHHWLSRWIISATHHQLHHQRFRCNYGLYFTFWDHLTGTQSVDYPEVYASIRGKNSVSSVQQRTTHPAID